MATTATTAPTIINQEQQTGVNVFTDKKTGDVLVRLFLISNEYINKQNWKVGTQYFDKNVQKSTGHDLVIYPVELKDGRTILDHPPYNTATASDIEASYKNQQNFSIGKAILNRKYKPTQYHSVYRITDPEAANWFKENSDSEGNLNVPIFTSPGILYTDKQKYDWENWIITHNAIVTKPANKEEDAGFFKSCTGDLETTCQHIAASALTPCMLEALNKAAPALNNPDNGKSVVNEILNSAFKMDNKNTSQESKEIQSIIMSNQGSDSSGNGQQSAATNDQNLQALLNGSNPITMNTDQVKKLASDLKVPEQLITSFVDYRTKYNELAKILSEKPTNNNDEDNSKPVKPESDDKGENNNNKDNKQNTDLVKKVERLERENQIQKMLPTALYQKQEDYDKDLEKFVNSKYDISDLKEIINVKIEKANIEAEKQAFQQTQKANASNKDHPQPNSAIASLLGGSYNNPGVNYEKASDNSAAEDDNKRAQDINELSHVKVMRSLLLNRNFGDLI